MKEYCILRGVTILSVFYPAVVNAATQPANFKEVVMIAVEILTALLPVIILLAFVYFFWGLIQYLKDDGQNKDEAKQIMLHGVIAFFMMASVWALVTILTTTFDTGQTIPDAVPKAEDWMGALRD